ncbi:MAG: SWIM zinc finger family protein [Xanthobacteraceae bacterium]|nr:SWIM zinc finger family protein [Xanthobacteraceae bacterium]
MVDAGSVATVNESEWVVENYIVKREPDGRIRCSCAGYKSKNICPHVAAVAITRGLT